MNGKHLLVAGLVGTAVSLSFVPDASAKTTLRVATLAPKNSSWGKVFRIWRKAVKKKTDGEVNLKIYYNAVQGNEGSMVGKMKTGQLDGAALTSVGLSNIYKNVLVMSLPGVSDSWKNLDKVRKAIGKDVLKGFESKGFHIFAWGDVGLVRQMSQGFAVRTPSDLKGKRPMVWRNEPLGPLVYSFIPGVVPVPKSVTEVLPALRAKNVEVINAPALAAEQLQWVPYLDHVSSQVSTCAIGATVFRKKAIDGIPADVRAGFDKIQKKVRKRGSKRIRKLDKKAYKRLTKKMTVVELSDADRKQWEALLRKAVKRLSQGTYDKALIKRAVKAVGRSID